MGTWDIGPFDNDAAGDLLVLLEEADPAERSEVIREALETAARAGAYLDYDDAAAAVAAAAIVARAGDAEPPVDVAGWPIELPPDLVPLGLNALEHVISEDSEWRALWAESPEYDAAVAELDRIRTELRQRSA